MSARNSYQRSMSGWYRKNPRFISYMLRELTAVFLAAYALILLTGLAALGRGPEQWAMFMGFLASPLSITLHVAILVAALYHTVSWFAVSPKATPPVYLGKNRLPDRFIIGAQYAVFLLVSLGLLLWAWSA
jgi:fumarate reductase subunit C